MADISEYQRRRERNYLLVIVSLGIICVGLGVVMVTSLRSAAAAKEDVDLRRLLTNLAWTALVLMVVSGLLLLWAFMRLVGKRVAAPLPKEPKSERIDAWAEAGRRIQVDDENEDDVEDYLDD